MMQPIASNDPEAALRPLYQMDDDGLLFVSPEIGDWQPIIEAKIELVIDLEGAIDEGVPTVPDKLMYVYYLFEDRGLPDLVKLDALARAAADLIRARRPVLIHCAMGLNRSPLLAGIVLTMLGMTGQCALQRLRERRRGALYNEIYADYLAALPASPCAARGNQTD